MRNGQQGRRFPAGDGGIPHAQWPDRIPAGADKRDPLPVGRETGSIEHDRGVIPVEVALRDDRLVIQPTGPVSHPDLILTAAIRDVREQPAVERPNRVGLVARRLQDRPHGAASKRNLHDVVVGVVFRVHDIVAALGYRGVLLAIRGAGDLPGAIAVEVGQPQMRAGGRQGDEPEDDVPVVWHPGEAAHPWCDVEAQPLQPSRRRAARHRNHPELPPPFGVVPFADRQDAEGSAVMGERQRTLDESPIRQRRVHGRRGLDGLARPGRYAGRGREVQRQRTNHVGLALVAQEREGPAIR